MKSDLLHRIAAIEAEMVGELDLRAVVSTPMPQPQPCAGNWADPARTDLSPVGFESDPSATFWLELGLFSIPAVLFLFTLFWLWPKQ